MIIYQSRCIPVDGVSGVKGVYTTHSLSSLLPVQASPTLMSTPFPLIPF